MASSDGLNLFLALLLVLLNGFFVAAEFSIVKVRYSQIQLRAEEGYKLAKQAQYIIKNLDAFLSATQLGITLASLALGWVGESALHHIIEGAFTAWGIAISAGTVTTISVVISFLIITMMHIVFGELVPKSIAIRKSENTTYFVATPLRIFATIFKPFILAMNYISNQFLRIIGIPPASENDIHSTEELQLLVKQSADSGEIQEENYEIIKNAFDFTDHNAKQVMVPRQNIFSINIEDPAVDIVKSIMESGYSRIPVFENTIDNVIGVFYAKEVIRAFVQREGQLTREDLEEMMREAFFVVGSKKISDLLKTFQQKKQHIAIVIDEFGGTEGLITLEDILEELVGEIQDEEDEESKIVDKVGANTYWVQATQPLDEINEHLPEAIPESEDGEFNTLAGFILHGMEDIPEENDVLSIGEYEAKILKMTNKSVGVVELVYHGSTETETLPADTEQE